MDTQTYATRISTRIPDTVGFDPITIIMILTTVLPLIMNCFNKEEPSPQLIHSKVVEFNTRNPKRLLVRTARRVRGEATEPMTKTQSMTIAQAIIDEAIETPIDEVASYSASCKEV